MRTLIILLLTTFTTLNVFGTAQFPDKIIYSGTIYSLNSNPLEDYFNKNPDKRPTAGIMCSALWRGYVATFEIKDSTLYLKDIEILVDITTKNGIRNEKWKSVIDEVFPNQTNIIINWFSGLLVLPNGKRKNYVQMGYGSTFKNYILLELDKGNLNKEIILGHRKYEKFKTKQFMEFKKTDEYQKVKNELKNEGNSDSFIDSFLRSFVTEYTSKILTK